VPTAPPVDLSHGLSVADGDRDFFEELVAMFLEEYPQHMATLHTALQDGQTARFMRVVQNLQEALGVIGATPAMTLTSELATMGRAACLEEASGVLAQLEQELTRVAAVFADPGWWDQQVSALRLRMATLDPSLMIKEARS
jgi:HPt (histidine-containing phosphotransfer) domain-containing protein